MYQLTRIYIIDILGTNNVETTGFTTGHPLPFLLFPQATKHERPDAMAIPHRKQPLGGADHQAEGAAATAHRLTDGCGPVQAAIHRLLQSKGDQLGIGGGSEFRREMIESQAQLGRIHQVAVVSQG